MKKSLKHSLNGRLARRVCLYVVLVSTLITLFTSAFQLYGNYKRDVSDIHSRLDEIGKIHISSVSARVWTLDLRELRTTLRGILELPSIEYIKVEDTSKLLLEVGRQTSKNTIIEHYPLHYVYRGKQQNIGELHIEASLEEIYARIWQLALDIIVSNAIKTFIVSGLILIIFFQLVGRHILHLSEHAESLDVDSLSERIKFKRNPVSGRVEDELDILARALNKMQNRLSQTIFQLKKKEQDLSVTLNSIAEAVITTNAQGMITRMNPIAESLTGWVFEEAQQTHLNKIFDIVNTNSGEAIQDPIEQVIQNNSIIQLNPHTTLIANNGSEYQITASAAPIRSDIQDMIGVILVFSDISEQYQLRKRAKQAHQQLQALFNGMRTMVAVLDKSGRIKLINDTALQLSAMGEQEFVGWQFWQCSFFNFSNKTRQAVHSHCQRAAQGEFCLHDMRIRVHNKIMWVELSIHPVMNEQNGVYELVAEWRDIDQRKKMQVEIRAQETQLRSSQKMEALGKLTGGVAHDYNNLLSIILGYTEQLTDKLNAQPSLLKYVQDISRAAQRGANLTNKLLSFSQQKTPNAQVIDINATLKEQRMMLEKTLTVRIELRYHLSENLWPTYLDCGDLENAIINMSINAMHAMQSGGTLFIHTSNQHIDPQRSKQLEIKAGDYVLLSIEDNGCGMEESTKERLFEPFFTTKGKQGTGLGLSQVYGFVDRSQGSIKVFSKPGMGSRFMLYFPRAYTNTQQAVHERLDLPKQQRGTETLLVIDDEAALVELTHEVLSAHGYTVLTAFTREDALSALQSHAVDLVISDVIMPNLNGYQFATEIMSLYPHIKIQMVSGYTGASQQNDTYHALRKSTLFKPYNTNQLLNRVRKLLDTNTSAQEKVVPTILVLDDEQDVRLLYQLNLSKLGYRCLLAEHSQQCLEQIHNAHNHHELIDAAIIDLNLPGDIDATQIAQRIRAQNPEIKLIISSGDHYHSVMTDYQAHGFDAALRKDFNRDRIASVLKEVLSQGTRYKPANTNSEQPAILL